MDRLKNTNAAVRNGVASLGFLLSVHVMALLFFSLFRVVLFVATDYSFPKGIAGDYGLYAVAFVRGLWFDNVVACYITALPLVVFWVAGLFGCVSKWLYRSVTVYFIVLYSLGFIISAANIPYFNYFFKPINSSIFNWFDYAGTTAGMVFGEASYYLTLLLGIAMIALFGYLVCKLSKLFYKMTVPSPARAWVRRQTYAVFAVGGVVVGLCFFGIRGRTGRNPIRISQAYYCTDPFLNQVGVAPVFSLMKSALDDSRRKTKN